MVFRLIFVIIIINGIGSSRIGWNEGKNDLVLKFAPSPDQTPTACKFREPKAKQVPKVSVVTLAYQEQMEFPVRRVHEANEE